MEHPTADFPENLENLHLVPVSTLDSGEAGWEDWLGVPPLILTFPHLIVLGSMTCYEDDCTAIGEPLRREERQDLK